MGLMFLLSVSGLLLATESMASQAGTVLADTSAGGDTAKVYQSFFEGNPVYSQTWSSYMYKWDGGVTIKRHGLEGDTVVDGSLYHKISVLGKNWENGWREQFWVRENETHDKVWVRLPWDSEGRERLVVDMNLKLGDLFPIRTEPDTVYYAVDTVYYVEHTGGNLKHIRLEPTTDSSWTQALTDTKELLSEFGCDWASCHLEFIEGVGSNLGFVYYRLGLSGYYEDTLWEPLRGDDYRVPDNLYGKLAPHDYIVCLEKNSMAYYVHPNPECSDCTDTIMILVDDLMYDEPDTNGPKPPRPANEWVQSMSRYLRLTPNPARDEVNLRWAAEAPVGGACRIELYTLQGLKLRTFVTDSWPYTLRVADLSSGTYVLRVVPEDASAAWQATVRLTRL